MGLNFDGFILRAPRSAPSNSENTSAPTTSVVRDLKPVSPDYFVDAPDLVDADAEFYNASVLNNPSNNGEEYLVWAANTSSFALGEGVDWSILEGTVTIPNGNSTVNDPNSPDNLLRNDGSTRILLSDDSGRTLADIFQVTFTRGSDGSVFNLTSGVHFTFDDPESGILNLVDDAATQAIFDVPSGSLAAASNLRGDQFSNAVYSTASARFWWTRNDARLTRFAWNGQSQKWQPLKGSTPKNLGALSFETRYELTPRPSGFSIGEYLPGTNNSDEYSMIRLGDDPGITSTPVGSGGSFEGILVVSDQSAIDDFDFGSVIPTEPAAVIGITNGVLQWNPNYVDLNVGLDIWYVFQFFEEDSNGVIGNLLDAKTDSVFITPVPGSTDRPFISLGTRKPLRPTLVANEASLPGSVPSGEVYIALSTGRVLLSETDVNKADPEEASFDIKFAGEKILFNGVALNGAPQPLMAPVELVDNTGTPIVVDSTSDLFVPDSLRAPGLGISGIRNVPDGTGNTPSLGTPGLRPGSTGLLREVESLGDTILYGLAGAIENLIVVDKASDAPEFNFQIPEGTAYVIRERSAQGSLVRLGTADRNKFSGQQMYFLQADFKPSYYHETAKILSRNEGPYTFEGGETLRFALNNIEVTWTATQGSFSASDIASSIQTEINNVFAPGTATDVDNKILLSSNNPTTGSVEIGYGDPIDISAGRVLGLLPGWIIDIPAGINWIAESGTSVGFYRSGVNLDRSNSTPDVQSTSRVEDETLMDSVMGTPLVTLSNPPRRDIAGYDEDIFFSLQEGFSTRELNNFEEVYYRFEDSRFLWIENNNITRRVELPTSVLNLERTNIIGESMVPQISGGLSVSSNGGPSSLLKLGEDFILIQDGAPGSALLVENLSQRFLTGFQGSYSQGSNLIVDLDTDFSNVLAGYKLEILNGDGKGFYLVEGLVNPNTLEVSPVFQFNSGSTPAQWVIYEGVTLDVNDGAIVADVVYENFNHFPEEPFHIRLLSDLGPVPPTEGDQSSNRLVAIVSDALEKGRPIVIRYDLRGNESDILLLQNELLGEIANGTLFVPGPGSDRFTDQAFSLQVGETLFEHGGANPLVPVASFSPTIPDGQVEYLTSTGEIAFADNVLSEYSTSNVHYVETFLSPSLLTMDEVELNPFNGELNLSSTAINLFGGIADAYFVEQMITENSSDVFMSPISGSIQFKKPLREGQVVETEYFRADSSGNVLFDEDGNPISVNEFLPRFIRAEVCERIGDRTYTFNSAGRTIDTSVAATVYVGADLQNFANQDQVGVVFEENKMFFTYNVDPTPEVTIGYAVYEAFSGDTAYTVSSPPVFRKPFFLEQNQNTFTLTTDRTGDVSPGKLLRLGNFPTYIQSSVYDPSTNLTIVEIFPQPLSEAGSRAPGNDVVTLLSGTPVTKDVNGETVSPNAPGGFFALISSEYETINKGSLEARFTGDFSEIIVVGALLEIGGHPFLVSNFEYDGDTNTTIISFTYPAPRSFEFVNDSARVSIRPIYPPEARNFIGVSPLVESEGFELILFGETDSSGNELPGRILVYNRDYLVDFNSGDITLLAPNQEALQPGQTLYFRYTKQSLLSPTISNGVVVYPRFSAGYSHVSIPTDANGYLDRILKATYTFDNPDSFYWRTVTVQDFLPEVVEEVTQAVQSQNPHGGPISTSVPEIPNYDQGSVGLLASRSALVDNDRVGREFIEFYNQVVLSFDHINETITGQVVGDRSGKFRFFVGRDRQIPGPGYEDPFSGELNNRNVWSEVFQAESAKGNGPFTFLEADDIVEPLTANVLADELQGRFPSTTRLNTLKNAQRALIQNDIDDIVLVDSEKPSVVRTSGFNFNLKAKGLFELMGRPHLFSRLFPEQVNTFTTTFPGADADLDTGDYGFYSFGRTITSGGVSERVSTYRSNIGTISNPVIGVIQNLSSVQPTQRFAAARIWAYSSTGFPELDSIIGTDFGVNPRPAVIATPMPLSQLPIDNTTGFPDFSQLVTQGGDLEDLQTGDFGLSRPPWASFAGGEPRQIAFGRPSGEIFDVGYKDNPLNINGQNTLPGVYLDEVIAGAVITFRENGGTITGPDQIVELQQNSTTGDPLVLDFGDTILEVPRSGLETPINDPPTQEDIQRMASNIPTLRVGFDIGVSLKDGQYFDVTYPSEQDPSFLAMKELLGQKPPEPFSTIQGIAQFNNTDISPLNIPALQGQALTDSGDVSLPYLTVENTELDRLGAATDSLLPVLAADTPLPSAVYPDEILDSAARAVTNPVVPGPPGADFPAVILTDEDLTPVATAGSYTPNSGIGDVQPYDLVLVETGASIQPGAQGILSVGHVEGGVGTSYIEPPRFVTPTRTGDRIRYQFFNAMVHVPGTGLTGVVVEEVGGSTFFRFNTISNFELNNIPGVGPTGGLNDIVDHPSNPFPNNNIITVNVYNIGGVQQGVFINGNSVTANLGTVGLPSAPLFRKTEIEIPATGFFDFTFHGGVAPGPVGPLDVGISIDTFFTGIATNGSFTGSIDSDRLTFRESYDLRNVGERGLLTSGGISVAGRLEVIHVTGPASDEITVNNAASVNGGLGFTFLRRPYPSPNEIGFFTAGSGGNIKVMSLESYGNGAISASGFTFSAIPSSSQDENGVIANGEGECDSLVPAPAANISFPNNKILNIGSLTGALENIQPYDIVAITGAVDNAAPAFPGSTASTKIGTYLVRHAIQSNNVGLHPEYREVALTASPGVPANTDWLSVSFPRITSFDESGQTITVDDVISVAGSPTGNAFAAPGVGPNPGDTTRIFVILNSVTEETYSARYTAIASNTFTLTDYEDENGVAIPASTFFSQVSNGQQISGMVYFDVHVRNADGLPESNTVGYDYGGTLTQQGFFDISLQGGAGSFTWTAASDIANLNFAVAGNNEVGVEYPTPNNGTSFVNNPDATFFNVVTNFFDFRRSSTGSTIWASVRTNTNAQCILPGDRFGSTFHAETGIFLEPSVPRSVFDLGDINPHVVDASNSLGLSDIGFRDATAFGIPVPDRVESVTWEVRRIRRFHEVQNISTGSLEALGFVYKIRTAVIDQYNLTANGYSQIVTATSENATNLGPFDNPDVNINPGDLVRVLDANGNVVETASISSVDSGDTLTLAPPVLLSASPGDTIEIFLQQAPVPHEQSNKELFEAMVESTLFETVADYTTQQGARAPSFNQLEDTNVNGISQQFGEGGLGIQVGDYIVVDPAGNVEGPTGPATQPEKGVRPFGDFSTSNRNVFTGWEGRPNDLDDNRGFYRIGEVQPAALLISEASEFAGVQENASDDVLFSEGNPSEYVIYPTIHDSGITGDGREGQQSLRTTALAGAGAGADPNSFLGNNFSIQPFSYKVVRPSSFFSQKAVETILMQRERLLSWMEQLDSFILGNKSGSYLVFQRDEHIADLGNNLFPDEGLGLLSNEVLQGILGLFSVSPFSNDNDCLSLLDRRFWILDERLDSQSPPFSGGSSYSDFANGVGRPVYPDYIEDILEREDQFRQLRYSWIDYRTNQRDGTIFQINNFDSALPRREEEQKRLLLLKKNTGE